MLNFIEISGMIRQYVPVFQYLPYGGKKWKKIPNPRIHVIAKVQ